MYLSMNKLYYYSFCVRILIGGKKKGGMSRPFGVAMLIAGKCAYTVISTTM